MIDTEALRKKVIDLAIQGKLTEQLPEDGSAEDLYAKIQEEKEKLIKEGKLKKQKPLPEIEEDEIPFEIPKNWKWVRFGELITLQSGRDLKSDEYNSEGRGIPYITGASNFGLNKELYINRWTECPKAYAKAGDILLSCKGTVGKIAILREDEVHIARQIMGIRVYQIDLLYALYFVEYMINGIKDLQKGLIPGIERNNVLSLLCALPPLEEQKRISALINVAFEQIDIIDELQAKYNKDVEVLKSKVIDAATRGELTEQLPEDGNAEDLYAQILEEKEKLIKEGKIKKQKPLPEIEEDEIPFEIPKNWRWVRVEALGENVNNAFADGPFGSNLKKEHYSLEHQVRIIQLSNVGAEGWKNENEKYTTYEHLKSIKRSEVEVGNIVIAKMMPAGRAIIVPNVHDSFVLSSDCVKIVPHRFINSKYMLYAINSEMFRKQVYKNVSGVGRVRTSLSKIKNYLLPLPSFNEQQRIANKLDMLIEYMK